MKVLPEQPPKYWLNFSQSLTSIPSAGRPLYKTLPCTLPVPGAGLTFSTPVSGAAVPALELAGVGRVVLLLPAAALPAGALPPQPASDRDAAKQMQVNS